VKQDFYLGMPYVGAALFAFFVFASVFAVALLRAISKPAAELDPLQRLPFEESGDAK